MCSYHEINVHVFLFAFFFYFTFYRDKAIIEGKECGTAIQLVASHAYFSLYSISVLVPPKVNRELARGGSL